MTVSVAERRRRDSAPGYSSGNIANSASGGSRGGGAGGSVAAPEDVASVGWINHTVIKRLHFNEQFNAITHDANTSEGGLGGGSVQRATRNGLHTDA